MDDAECAIRIEWEGLTVEATCPPGMFAQTLGMVGNEMLRLNVALVAMGETRAETPHRRRNRSSHHRIEDAPDAALQRASRANPLPRASG